MNKKIKDIIYNNFYQNQKKLVIVQIKKLINNLINNNRYNRIIKKPN